MRGEVVVPDALLVAGRAGPRPRRGDEQIAGPLVGHRVLVGRFAIDGDPEAAEESTIVGQVLRQQSVIGPGDGARKVAARDGVGVLALGGGVVVEAVEAGGGGDDEHRLIGVGDGKLFRLRGSAVPPCALTCSTASRLVPLCSSQSILALAVGPEMWMGARPVTEMLVGGDGGAPMLLRVECRGEAERALAAGGEAQNDYLRRIADEHLAVEGGVRRRCIGW